MLRRRSSPGLAAIVGLCATVLPATANPVPARFVHESPDSAHVHGHTCAITMDASDRPVVRCLDVGSPIPFPVRLERVGRGWTCVVLDETGLPAPESDAPSVSDALREALGSATPTSVGTDADHVTHAAFATVDGVRYVRSGATRTIETVWDPPAGASVVSLHLAVGEPPEPIVAFVTALDGRSELRLASRTREGWRVELVDDDRPIACALALDSHGTPHLAYTVRDDDGRLTLRYATRALYGVRVPDAREPHLEVSAGPGVVSATAHLRAGGERTFTSRVELRDGDGDGVLEGRLDGDLLGARGLEMYLTAVDDVMLGSAEAPVRVPLSASMTAPPGPRAGRALPIAAPLIPESQEATAAHLDDVFDGAPWAMWTWDPTDARYRRLPADAPLPLRPGVGVWLAVPAAATLTLEGRTSFPETDDAFEVELSPGWNLVGNPAPYRVSLDPDALRIRTPVLEKPFAQAATDGQVRGTIYVFDPANTDSAGYRLDLTALEPWACAWVRNETSATLVLRVPARAADEADRDVPEPAPLSWRLGLRARAGDEETSVALAFAARGEDVIDMLDVYMPPAPPDRSLDMHVEHPGDILTGGPVRLYRDVRSASIGEADWSVEVSSADAPVELSWGTPTRNAMSGFVAVGALTLVDPYGNEWDMAVTRSISLPAGRHALRVLARPAPVTPVGPVTFDAVIRPNPLRSETTFHYELPEPGAVTLGVFDILGRLVWSYEHALAPAGGHAVFWDGHDVRGQRVQPGTYFLRVAFDGAARAHETLTRKMTILP